MSNPLASIWDDVPVISAPVTLTVKPKYQNKQDHSEARAIYEKYLVKIAELERHREYAQMVAKATSGPSMTPVEPLATMGCNGGALLCDHCQKPIILEGGKWHKIYADAAWASATPAERVKWMSYISGGMVVEIVENGTLRIYHGYSRPSDCDFHGRQELKARSDAHERDNSKSNIIWKFIDEELVPTLSRDQKNLLLSSIMSVMFSFDPGFGVNRPCQQS